MQNMKRSAKIEKNAVFDNCNLNGLLQSTEQFIYEESFCETKDIDTVSGDK